MNKQCGLGENLSADEQIDITRTEQENMIELGQRVTLIALVSNAALCLFKLLAGYLGKSTAMIADGFHSLSDVLATVVVYFGLRIARKPSDTDHPYGHGKAESLASLVVACFLLAAGISIGKTAVVSIITGEIATPGGIALAAALVSIIVQETMFRLSMRVGKKINSEALQANAWHHRSDALSSVGTLVGIGGALIGGRLGNKWLLYLDPAAGLIVSVIILKVSVDIFHKSVHSLMDGAVGQEIVDDIYRVIDVNCPECRVESLKARYCGPDLQIDMILQVPDEYTVVRGHDIAENARKVLCEQIPHVEEVMIHIHPKEIDRQDAGAEKE